MCASDCCITYQICASSQALTCKSQNLSAFGTSFMCAQHCCVFNAWFYSVLWKETWHFVVVCQVCSGVVFGVDKLPAQLCLPSFLLCLILLRLPFGQCDAAQYFVVAVFLVCGMCVVHLVCCQTCGFAFGCFVFAFLLSLPSSFFPVFHLQFFGRFKKHPAPPPPPHFMSASGLPTRLVF